MIHTSKKEAPVFAKVKTKEKRNPSVYRDLEKFSSSFSVLKTPGYISIEEKN